MLEIPDILGWTVYAGPEPTYAEKMRVPPLGLEYVATVETAHAATCLCLQSL